MLLGDSSQLRLDGRRRDEMFVRHNITEHHTVQPAHGHIESPSSSPAEVEAPSEAEACYPQGDVSGATGGYIEVILGLYRDNGKEHGNYCIIMLNLRVLAAADRQTTLHIGCLLGKPVSRPWHCPAHHSFKGHVESHAEQKCNIMLFLHQERHGVTS